MVIVLYMPTITSGSRINRWLGEEQWLLTLTRRGFAEATWNCVILLCQLWHHRTTLIYKTIVFTLKPKMQNNQAMRNTHVDCSSSRRCCWMRQWKGEWMQRKSGACWDPEIPFLRAISVQPESLIQESVVLVWVWVAPSLWQYLNKNGLWKYTCNICAGY